MQASSIDKMSQLYDRTDAILICDKHGYVEYAKWMNDQYFSITETVGMHILELYPDLTEETSTILQTLKSGQARYDERQIITNFKGDNVDVITTTLPIYNKGELIGAMAESVFYDQYKTNYNRMPKHRDTLYGLEDIITVNPIMNSLKNRCRYIASSDSPVLLYGETGTGKELFAQSLHSGSNRSQKPFISQNCAAIPQALLEGIFFGTEKGSFTGADTRKGLFEMADGGTLFLDEINSMDIGLQAKLLKVIEEQKVRRIGGYKDIYFNTRIICAMNQNPTDLLNAGKIREDLFYRISVVRIDILPLRERKEDIEVLTDYFINYFNRKMNKSITGVSELVKMTFENYDWMGNVRELKNTLESAFNVARTNTINMTDLPPPLLYFGEKHDSPAFYASADAGAVNFGIPLAEHLAQYEKNLICAAIAQSANISEAAKLLKLSRQSLSYKIEKYAISCSFQSSDKR